MIFGFLSWILALTSPIDTGSIASHHATYDGTALCLEGEVALEHGFGTMKAEKAILTKQKEEQEEFPFTCVELTTAVKLALTTQAQVECEKATLDFSTLKGVLTSPEHVHYVDFIKRENHVTAFELFSPHLDLQLMKNPQKKGNYDIEKAHAIEGVHLIYDNLYHLQTESIFFSKDMIYSEPATPCVWTYQNDRMDAEKFDLDLAHNELTLKKAKGHLSSFSKGEVHLTAETLLWKHAENLLKLQGSPYVQESHLGTVVSDQEIQLILKDQTLDRLVTAGQTTLTSQKGHRLTTYAPLEIDGEKRLATIRTPLSNPDLQLTYEEEEMKISADQAQIYYQEDVKGLHPSSVELQGHIKLFSQEKEGPSRRGIADILTYNPETRACILKAYPGQKVLFMRDQDELRISASEIHITYDPVSKEQHVRGVGRVALSFSPEEQHLLNQVFRHVPSSS